MSQMFRNSDVHIYGGSFTSVVGDLVSYNTFGLKNGFDVLCEHVAANASFKSKEVSDQPKCHEGTRIAILEHLVSWAEALTYTYPITWLHGPAGSGKSTILRTVAKILFDRGLLLASFFFSRSSAGRNSAEKFIPSLAYQLALSIPDTHPLIVEAIERDPLLFSASLWDQAQALIIDPIHAVHITSCIVASPYPRIFVIDGLDECSDPYKQHEIMQVLLRVLQHLPIPFAVLIASRPEYNIRDAFNRGDLNNNSARLSLDNEYKADEDIKKYLIVRFRTIRRTHPLKRYLPSPWPPNGVLEALIFKASGQFIYASTVDKFISSPRHRPEERLDIVMNAGTSGEPFEQLDLLYSAILSVIDPADLHRTLHVLALLFLLPSWLLLFEFSNSPKFLEKLLGLQAGDVRRLLFGLESLLTVDRDDESSIHIFHTSLSDYLFDKSRARQFWIDTGEVCAEVAQRLLPHSVELWAEPQIYRLVAHFIIHFFHQAKPTSILHEAIMKDDFIRPKLTLAQLETSYRIEYYPALLVAIRNSNFPDICCLYGSKSVGYLQYIRPYIQLYFDDPILKASFIMLVFIGPIGSESKQCIQKLGVSESMLEIDEDEMHGFSLTKERSGNFKTVIRDAFLNSADPFFINENEYADVALQLMMCMTEGSDFYITDTIPEPSKVENRITFILPHLLSQSATRVDLIQYMEQNPLSDVYMKYTDIIDALAHYRRRAANMTWLARLQFLLRGSVSNPEGRTEMKQVKVSTYHDS